MARIGKQKIIRWFNSEGNRVKANSPGAIKKTTESESYFAFNIKGHPRGKAFPLGTTRKDIAQKKLGELIKQAELGHSITQLDKLIQSSIQQHLDDFIQDLGAGTAGDAEKSIAQVKQTRQRIQAVVDGCGFNRIADIDATTIATYLQDRRGRSRSEGGINARTSNFYMQCFKLFVVWLVKKKRLAENPLTELKRVDVAKDIRHDRDKLTPEELHRLLTHTGNSQRVYRGMIGRDRRFLYLLALSTGFRRGELLGLTPRHFDLENGYIHLSATETKNGKPAKQPIHPDVVAEARAFLAGKPRNSRLFPGTWHEKSSRMIQKDLTDAGIPYKVQCHDGSTRYRDFHSLRHTFISSLASNGVDIKTAQVLARHQDAKLTIQVYTHADTGNMARAVASLPTPGVRGNASTTAMPAEQMARGFILLSVLFQELFSRVDDSNLYSNQEKGVIITTNRKTTCEKRESIS